MPSPMTSISCGTVHWVHQASASGTIVRFATGVTRYTQLTICCPHIAVDSGIAAIMDAGGAAQAESIANNAALVDYDNRVYVGSTRPSAFLSSYLQKTS
jgi:hypothetical protein